MVAKERNFDCADILLSNIVTPDPVFIKIFYRGISSESIRGNFWSAFAVPQSQISLTWKHLANQRNKK